MDFDGAKSPGEGGGEPQGRRIDVAPHRLDRCKGTELVEHSHRSYVTGMQDLVDAV
jgi:hypothetical protein